MIVIFSSSCVKTGGSVRMGERGTASAGRGHPLLVDNSSYMAAAPSAAAAAASGSLGS